MNTFWKILAPCMVLALLYCQALSATEMNEGQILAAAWQDFNEGQLTEAAQGFASIQEAKDPQIRQNARMGLGHTRLKQGNPGAARAIFSDLVRQGYQLPKTLPALLSTYPEGDAQRAAIARRILDLDPDHEFALVVSAWDHYHHKHYAEAEAEFTRLSHLAPQNEGNRIGLGYSLLHRKKIHEARHLVDTLEGDLSEDLLALRQNVYAEAIAESLDQNRPEEAVQLLDRLAQFDCDRSRERIAGLGEQILDRCAKTEGQARAFHLADNLGKSPLSCLRRAAAQFYHQHQAPITASQVFKDPDTCFANADSPWMEARVFHRHRSGDPGLSRLDETAFPVSGTLAFFRGHQLTLSHVTKRLDSADPSAVRAGSHYLYENGTRAQAFLDNRSAFHQVWLNYKKEGPYPLGVAIGTSPMGGDVSTTPLFDVRTALGGFDIDIHRSAVEESILSYAGLDDPYGEESWGRVTRTGGKLRHTLALGQTGWISARIGFDAYQGENVMDNTAWLADLALGQTKPLGSKWQVSYGMYGAYQHFERNSNFFTFGHGGYYSPNHMVSAGPLLRIQTLPCQGFYLDIQASGGWMWEQTDDAPFYPGQVPLSALSDPGRNAFYGTYEGNRDQGPTALVQIKALRLLSPRWALGGDAMVNLTAEYNEWQVGFHLKYYFKNQRQLTHPL